MAQFIKKGNMRIGYAWMQSIRKKPCIVVQENNVGYVLGTFKNENDAKFFVEKLAELTGAVRGNEDAE